jgi:hypothetical protein
VDKFTELKNNPALTVFVGKKKKRSRNIKKMFMKGNHKVMSIKTKNKDRQCIKWK